MTDKGGRGGNLMVQIEDLRLDNRSARAYVFRAVGTNQQIGNKGTINPK